MIGRPIPPSGHVDGSAGSGSRGGGTRVGSNGAPGVDDREGDLASLARQLDLDAPAAPAVGVAHDVRRRLDDRELEERPPLGGKPPLGEDAVARGREEADRREVRLGGEVDRPSSSHEARDA